MKAIQNGIFAIGLSLINNSAQAATFCVGTSAELDQALVTAAGNSAHDLIRIKSGTYTDDGNLAFGYTTSQNFALTIAGGYLSSPANCAVQSKNPALTVLSGSNQRRVLDLTALSGSGGFSVSNLTIRAGANPPGQSGSAGLDIGGAGDFDGTIVVSRVVFDRNTSADFGGGLIVSAAGIVSVINNLFLLNRCGGNDCAMSATVNGSTPSEFTAFFGNNTFVGNACSAGAPVTCTTGGARLGGSARAAFYNNLFAANSGAGLKLGGSLTELYNNNIVSIIGTPALMSGNLNFANPQLVDLINDDVRLQPDSPMRNAGTPLFVLLTSDLDGNARVVDSIVDIGAYEFDDSFFKNGFEQPPVE
ncbi:MAG: choice-of-anchor Q domain-containing protein [Pseudomonadota bacterium]|nr:choice-of-anchor Q domain-containing protein [Pseudomonadota bacterium]